MIGQSGRYTLILSLLFVILYVVIRFFGEIKIHITRNTVVYHGTVYRLTVNPVSL